MATYTGNETVKGGYYLNTGEWKLEVVERPEGVLPGDVAARFVRVPALLMLPLAPIMGLVFVVLIPFFGLAVLIEQGWHKAAPYVRAARREAAAATVRKEGEGPRR